ncbi:MAG: hypothetical protein ACFLMY_19720 [Candidatus Brachytrichaceae bacterium NZ_4S206]|jgi:hypothetical protein
MFSLILVAATFPPALTVHAQRATFLATWQNAWLRAAPSVTAPRVAPVAQGATYEVIGRSTDGQWLALATPGFRAWLPAGFGEASGSLASVPVILTRLPPAPKNTNMAALPEWIVMTARGRELYRRAVKAGRDPRMFTVAGDSNSTWQRALGRIAPASMTSARTATSGQSLRALTRRSRG